MNPLILLIALDCKLNAKNETNCEANGNFVISQNLQWNFYATYEKVLEKWVYYLGKSFINNITDTTRCYLQQTRWFKNSLWWY